MNLLAMADAIHHFKTYGFSNMLRKRGILDEGYNPKTDSYDHTLFGLPFKRMKFQTLDTVVRNIQATDPFIQQMTAKQPRTVYLKKKFEVVLPKGETRRYSKKEFMLRDLMILRSNLTALQGLNNVSKQFMDRLCQEDHRMGKTIRRTRGCAPSQLGCDPNAIITVRNLETGKCTALRPYSFPVFKVSENCQKFLALA